MEEHQFKDLSKKMDTIIKLLAVQSLGNKKGREAISILSNFGFQPKDIATFIGTTPHTVSVALNKMKRKNVEKDGQ